MSDEILATNELTGDPALTAKSPPADRLGQIAFIRRQLGITPSRTIASRSHRRATPPNR